jgi:hypothetical protein
MRDWIKSAPAYSNRSVRSAVADQNVVFYPISVELVFSLRTIAPPLARVVSSLLDRDPRRDQRTSSKTWNDPNTGELSSHVETDPVSLETTAARAASRSEAIDEMVGTVLGDDAKALLGQMILDSIRPRSDTELPTQVEGLEFFCGLGLDVLKDYLSGVLKANQGVFSPLARWVTSIKSQLGARIEMALTSTMESPAPDGSPPSPDADAARTENRDAAQPLAPTADAST